MFRKLRKIYLENYRNSEEKKLNFNKFRKFKFRKIIKIIDFPASPKYSYKLIKYFGDHFNKVNYKSYIQVTCSRWNRIPQPQVWMLKFQSVHKIYEQYLPHKIQNSCLFKFSHSLDDLVNGSQNQSEDRQSFHLFTFNTFNVVCISIFVVFTPHLWKMRVITKDWIQEKSN